MTKRLIVMTTLALASTAGLGAATAHAEDNDHGVSFCSNSGRPVGYEGQDIFTNPDSYNNTGEVVSWATTNDARIEKPGQLVKLFCNPVR